MRRPFGSHIADDLWEMLANPWEPYLSHRALHGLATMHIYSLGELEAFIMRSSTAPVMALCSGRHLGSKAAAFIVIRYMTLTGQ